MNAKTLKQRITDETQLTVTSYEDQHILTGIFNRYRPDGKGLERILSDQGLEGKVRANMMRVYEATAKNSQATDLYFVVRQFEVIDYDSAKKIAQTYLAGIRSFAKSVGDDELSEALTRLKFLSEAPEDAEEDEDISTMIYECMTDFLAEFDMEDYELFILDEALYSMACDYFLMAYMLLPVIGTEHLSKKCMDAYFDLWKHGIALGFYGDGQVVVKLPAA